MIYAIIVSFNPNLAALASCLGRLRLQVDKLIIVDNASHAADEVSSLGAEYSAFIVKNNQNNGVAGAINQGINIAIENSAKYVLLLDQDSLPDQTMVQVLKSAFEDNVSRGHAVAAVGPSYEDVKGQAKSPFVRRAGFMLERVDCPVDEIVEVDHLITSGSLISLDAIETIGLMEEALFIDYVDTEWCLRSKSKGYKLYGVGAAKMEHDLGEKNVWFMGRQLPVHSPFRYYYAIRNGVWLLCRPWVDFRWRLLDIRRLFLIYVVYSLFVGQRFENWKMLTRGIWHGIIGKMGKLDER
jgi:rhamnosyltransferase